MNTSFVRSFKAARRVSTPLIAVQTPDQAMTIETLNNALTNGSVPPILQWDCVRGIQWVNQPGLAVCWTVIGQKMTAPVPTTQDELNRFRVELGRATINIVNTLEAAQKLPESAVLICMNMQMAWDKAPVIQAAWNLRDQFKQDQRVLVMLTDMGAVIPLGLRDALPLVEELPTLEELAAIVDEQAEAAGITITPEVRTAAVNAVCGLPAFSAEQSIALSFMRNDAGEIYLNTEAAWDRKSALVSQTHGLSVWRGRDSFDTLGGLHTIKSFMLDVLRGQDPPRAIVFIDEIEKAFAGASGGDGSDSSGTTQEMHGTLLSEMQNQEYTGIVIVGPPGTGKSAFAKALAGEAGCPCIMLDISGMKSKYVGSSNENLNAGLAVIRAVSQGKALFIATCNAVAQLPPELKRRFTLGTFFMDLPNEEERQSIWDLYLDKYELQHRQTRPNDEGWTGADIKQCCSLAWRLKRTLLHASQFLTPVAQTDAERIERLRQDSSGKYLSASYDGKYTYDRAAQSAPKAKGKRSIRVE